MKKLLALFTFATLVAGTAWAAPKAVTLSVPGMTCAACPFTVKAALSKVEGVSKVGVSYEKREAAVVYDDGKTSPDALTKAVANAGYPASVKP
jgi:mercuric ion binding protein